MVITSIWNVISMDVYPERDGATNVVFVVHWIANATDGEYTGSVYDSQELTLDADGPFTPFADLTEAQVIGWVQKAMGEEKVAAHEANMAQQIADLISPPVLRPPLPWAAT